MKIWPHIILPNADITRERRSPKLVGRDNLWTTTSKKSSLKQREVSRLMSNLWTKVYRLTLIKLSLDVTCDVSKRPTKKIVPLPSFAHSLIGHICTRINLHKIGWILIKCRTCNVIHLYCCYLYIAVQVVLNVY